MLGDDVSRIWGRDDLCSSEDSLFVASGVCSGYLPGIEKVGDQVAVHSEIIDVAASSRRYVTSHY